MPRSAPPGAPPASALYQLSAYGCAIQVSTAAARAIAPATTTTARCSRSAPAGRVANRADARAAARAAQIAPTAAAMQIVGSTGIQCFSAPKIGVVPRTNGPIEAAAES